MLTEFINHFNQPIMGIQEKIAFAGDRIFRGPLENTNFRVTREMLDRIDSSVGKELGCPLREAIIQSRLLSLRGLLVRQVAQTGLIFSIASGTATPESSALQLATIWAGTAIETYDREQSVRRVEEVAFPVTLALVHGYEEDLYYVDDLDSLPSSLAADIATGESLPHPQLTLLAHLAFIAPFLLAAGEYNPLLVRAAVEGFLQLRIYKTLKEGPQLQQLLSEIEVRRQDNLRGQHMLGLDPDKDRIPYLEEHNVASSWSRRSLEHALVQLLFNASNPLAAFLEVSDLVSLSLALTGGISTNLQSLFSYRESYAQARAGMIRLNGVLDAIEDPISLRMDHQLGAYCDTFTSRTYIKEPEDPNVVAVIAPFIVTFKGQKEPTLILEKPLVLSKGIISSVGPARGGRSLFQRYLNHEIGAEQEHESIIQTETGWARMHRVGLTLREYLGHTPPEPQRDHRSPIALFAEDPIPRQAPNFAGEYINGLLRRNGKGDLLTEEEKIALSLLRELSFGSKTREQIINIRDDRIGSIILSLLAWAPPLSYNEVNKRFRRKLNSYGVTTDEGDWKPLFHPDEIDRICQAEVFSELKPSYLRAKLRLIALLDKEPKKSIISIDQTLDSIPNDDLPRWIGFIEEWLNENNAVIIIGASKDKLHEQMRGSPVYRGEIIFDIGTPKHPRVNVVRYIPADTE